MQRLRMAIPSPIRSSKIKMIRNISKHSTTSWQTLHSRQSRGLAVLRSRMSSGVGVHALVSHPRRMAITHFCCTLSAHSKSEVRERASCLTEYSLEAMPSILYAKTSSNISRASSDSLPTYSSEQVFLPASWCWTSVRQVVARVSL